MRIQALRRLMGSAGPACPGLVRGIRGLTRRNYNRHVVPLVQQHWPEMLQTPFATKLEIATCDLYAAAPYTVLFCAPKRPLPIRIASGLANAIAFPLPLLSVGLRLSVAGLGRFALHDQHRRIVLVAAFIGVIDHAFDHCVEGEPAARGARLKGLLEGSFRPEEPVLCLIRALQLAMADALPSQDRVAFEAAMERVKDWIDAEVAGSLGAVDELGLGHRLAGIEGTIDGLLFPVVRWTGEGARHWMYRVSLFVQMIDDYIDLEADIAEGRRTPFVSGEWTFSDIEKTWNETLEGIEELAQKGGLASPHYTQLLRDTYAAMLRDILRAMADGTAA